MAQVYLALGSNLAQPLNQVERALGALNAIPGTRIVKCSSLYRSKPMGPQDQPDYLNAVVLLETTLSPLSLLDHTQRIELEQGRERKEERWGPRTLDLDMLTFDNQTINTPRLTVPHYGLKVREFMLYPFIEIAPDFILPDGDSLKLCLSKLPLNGMTLWHDNDSLPLI